MYFGIPKLNMDSILAALAILASTVAVVLISEPPRSALVVTAVFPPWWSAAEVLRVVDPIGAAASSGRSPNVVTVYGGTDLQSQLRQAGVWLILDPRLLSCGPSPELS